MAHKRPASARGLLITCSIAGQAKWLKLDPAVRDILEPDLRNRQTDRALQCVEGRSWRRLLILAVAAICQKLRR